MIALSPKPAALPFLLMGWAVLWAVAMAVPGSPAGTLPCQLAICLPLAAMFGLPHGATDWWLAAERLPARLGAARGRYWALWFSAIYLLGSLAAVALIMVAPALALILFIAGSVWHWGVFDARAHGLANSPYAWLACALPPIAAPLAFRPHDSALLLQALGVAATPLQIAEAGFAGLLLAAAALTQLRKPPCALGRELVVLLVMCAIAPPLAAFCGVFLPGAFAAPGRRPAGAGPDRRGAAGGRGGGAADRGAVADRHPFRRAGAEPGRYPVGVLGPGRTDVAARAVWLAARRPAAGCFLFP